MRTCLCLGSRNTPVSQPASRSAIMMEQNQQLVSSWYVDDPECGRAGNIYNKLGPGSVYTYMHSWIYRNSGMHVAETGLSSSR